MDFVAGWLGTLSNFVDSNWYLDPVTRQSRSITSNVIDLRNDFDLEQYTSTCCNFNLTPNSNMYYATKAHRINNCHWGHVESGAIKIINLVATPDIDQTQVQWEFFFKTYGRLEDNGSWHIDKLISKQDITNADRINQLHQLLLKIKEHDVFHTEHTNIEFPKIVYSELFKPGGSIYLCDKLGLSVDRDFHAFWDAMLPLAYTPHEVTLWGETWRLQDYVN